MVGNLVAKMAAWRRSELGDLCPAVGLTGRPTPGS